MNQTTVPVAVRCVVLLTLLAGSLSAANVALAQAPTAHAGATAPPPAVDSQGDPIGYRKRQAYEAGLRAHTDEADKAWRRTENLLTTIREKIAALLGDYINIDNNQTRFSSEVSEAKTRYAPVGGTFDGGLKDVHELVAAYRRLSTKLNERVIVEIERAKLLSKNLSDALIEDVNANLSSAAICRPYKKMSPEQIEGLKKFGIDASRCVTN